jgi:hypothetical protein
VDGRDIEAHRCILATGSPVLKKFFYDESGVAKEDRIIMDNEDYDVVCFIVYF